MTDRASAEGLRKALFDCYALLPPERLDLLRDETKRTIDIAAALRDTGPRPDSTPDRAETLDDVNLFHCDACQNVVRRALATPETKR